ncbi:MAG: hypothetical protein EOP49_13705 [Sphingobacteriales bacterium]|nr:MAG: hypothetical protein EOP49_13705 [Sphingobacteriales bacterium]
MSADRPAILVVGGSLGAKSINEAIDKSLDEIVALGVQLIWQTGKPYFHTALQRAAGMEGVHVTEFIPDMGKAYAAADLVISRAGALAISELCIVAKPVIFVPYPHAAEDHQTSNAKALVDRNAAMMVRDADAGNDLFKKIKALLGDAAMQELMQRNLKAMAIMDADVRIAKRIIEIAGNRR